MKTDDIKDYYNDPRLIAALDKWDVLEFLSSSGVSYQMEGKNIGVGFVGVSPCPNCGDYRNHFAIHKEKKYGSCFICKCYYGPLRLISHYKHIGIEKAFYYLINLNEEEMDVEQRVKMILKGVENKPKQYEPKGQDPLPKNKSIGYNDIKNNMPLRLLMQDKRLNLWHTSWYDLRLGIEFPFKNHLIWPIYSRDKQASFQARRITSKKYYAATHLSNYLYGYDWIMPDKPLLLVEGFFDYTRIDSYIRCYYPNDISITTGMLKSISQDQMRLLSHLKIPRLIIMFDQDSWFDYYRVKNAMPYDVQFIILPYGKDPNELEWNEIHSIFKKEIML